MLLDMDPAGRFAAEMALETVEAVLSLMLKAGLIEKQQRRSYPATLRQLWASASSIIGSSYASAHAAAGVVTLGGWFHVHSHGGA